MLTLQNGLIWNSSNMIFTLLILWWSMLLVYMNLRNRCYGQTAAAGFIAITSYWMLQLLFETAKQPPDAWMCAAVTALCAVLALSLVVLKLRYRKWTDSHLSYRTFKEAVDKLPVGVCCYREDGRVILKNRTMEALCRRISGQALLNGSRFCQTVFTAPLQTCQRRLMEEDALLVFDDGTAFSFSCTAVKAEEQLLHMLIAADMTQEYSRTQALQERKQMVEQLNERMTAYQREVLALIASQEVLNAKVKIHNELGTSLLATRKYLLNGSDADKDTLLQMIRQNLTFLKQDAEPQIRDEYELILSTAHELGLEIELSGELPQEESMKHIAAAAIHECCTNTIRHAGGNKLWVCAEHDEHAYRMDLCNNGKQPTEPVAEKGGLSSLRRLVEQVGGTMTITISPDFHLTIILSKEGNANAL